MFLTVLKWIMLSIVIAALSGLLYLSRNDFIISSGSDALTTIMRPAIWAQVFSLFFAAISLYACLFFSLRSVRLIKWLVFFATLFVFSLSIHSFVIDAKCGSFRDVWGLFDVQQLPFDLVEGPAHDVTYDKDLFWLNLYRGQDRIRIFLGITPWRINTNGIMRDLHLVKARKPD